MQWRILSAITLSIVVAGCSGGGTNQTGSLHEALLPQGGFVIVTGDDSDDASHGANGAYGNLYHNLFVKALADSKTGGSGILDIGSNSGNALSSFNSWVPPGTPVTFWSGSGPTDLSAFKMIFIASVEFHTAGGMNGAQLAALNARAADIKKFVNEQGGSLIALTEANTAGGWGWLPVPLTTQDMQFNDAHVTPELTAISPTTTDGNYSHVAFHNVFTGPANFSGLKVLATKADAGAGFGLPVLLGGSGIKLSAEVCTDGIDNDGDGLTDYDDPDCQVCGNHHLDPNEQCDDGNVLAGDGCSPTCQIENLPPVARCIDVTVNTGASCAVGANVNNGSSDPDGPAPGCVASPAGPYGLGTTPVTLTCTDSGGLSASCTATVTVVDNSAPTIACPVDQLVNTTGNDAVVQYPAPTASDNCGAVVTCSPASGDTLSLGDHAVTCVAKDAAGNTAACQFDVHVNAPPDAICNDVQIAADAQCQGAASVDNGSKDRDGDLFVCQQLAPPPYNLGATPVTLTCTDSHGTSSACSASVTVVDKTPPSITCPPNQVVECNGGQGSAAYAATVSDNCSVASTSCTPPSGSAAGVGAHDVTCSAADAAGNSASCTFSVEVRDSAGPVVTTVANTIEIWPPNHKYKSVSLADCVTKVVDACQGTLDIASAGKITRVTSDELEDDKLGNGDQGDGNTCDDIVITGNTGVDLRAERLGDGTGRMYTIFFDVSDGHGNVTHSSCRAGVPHDQGKGGSIVAEDCAYCVGSGCGTCPGHDPRCGK